MDQTSLIELFTSILGEIPPEFDGLVYVFFVFVILYVIDQFFTLLSTVFGVTKWRS